MVAEQSVLLVAALSCVAAKFSVDNADQLILDESGRARYFHGTNMVVKRFPWVAETWGADPAKSITPADMKLMSSWGLNALRLGVMWPGAEPVRGEFNKTYFDEIRKIVDWAAAEGIYTILDWHQDVLSESFCGEGVPPWALALACENQSCATFPQPWAFKPYATHGNPAQPSDKDCASHSFTDFYASWAVSEAFQGFYDDRAGSRAALSLFWRRVAEEFKGNDGILGAELLNEPWAGDIYKNPKLVLPTAADKLNIEKLTDILAAQVWSADPDRMVLFTGVTWDDWQVGFQRPPLNNSQRSILSYHYYNGVSPIGAEQVLTNRVADAARLRLPIFMSEFGLSDTKAQLTVDAADRHTQSWTIWQYKDAVPITEDANSSVVDPHTAKVTERALGIVSRPYPHALCGRAAKWSYSAVSDIFELSFAVSFKACDAHSVPTLVHLGVPNATAKQATAQRTATLLPAGAGSVAALRDVNALSIMINNGTRDGERVELRVENVRTGRRTDVISP